MSPTLSVTYRSERLLGLKMREYVLRTGRWPSGIERMGMKMSAKAQAIREELERSKP